MPRKPTGNPPGPPQKEIDLDQVIYWAQLQATAEEIASSFRVSPDTLDRRLKKHFGMGYAELLKRVGGSAKLSLRRYQFKLAEKNVAMAIWLGKQWLGQKEPRDEQITNQPILLKVAYGSRAPNEVSAAEIPAQHPECPS